MEVQTLTSSPEKRPGTPNSVQKVTQKMSYSKGSLYMGNLGKSEYKSAKRLHRLSTVQFMDN